MTREWLETDGLGGYASSTVLLCPTRRYHGLLVAPFEGTVKRHVFLSRFEETLEGGGKSVPISMARYRGLWSPLGHQCIEEFSLEPFPTWVYLFGSARIERSILMLREPWKPSEPRPSPTVVTRWRVSGQRHTVHLRLRPLLPCREADATTVENEALDPRVDRLERGLSCRPYRELPAVAITASGRFTFERDPVWYRGLEYAADAARGYESHEDQFSPGTLDLELEEGVDVHVAATIGAPIDDPRERYELEADRRRAAAANTIATFSRGTSVSIGAMPRGSAGEAKGATKGGKRDDARDDGSGDARGEARGATKSGATQGETSIDVAAALAETADAFLYRAHDGRVGVVAGYPWFLEWGRDTFLSLPGLLLARGRVAECGEALRGALTFLRDGLMPNIFGRTPGESAYNSVDAALWFARCVRLYELAGAPPREIVGQFLPALRSIARCYRDGTELGIRCDAQGLITAGDPRLNATWMDARTSQGPVTPRDGCAVEINALWYFLLEYLERLEARAGDMFASVEWRTAKERAGAAFTKRFWLARESRLADTWNAGVVDRSVRPNMVIAAALEWTPLSREQRSDVVACSRAELLTARGLRTLGPKDRAYQGRFSGGPEERDQAYHQGTVWPWLLGFHVEAALACGAQTPAELRALLDGFAEHLGEAGLGHVSEVFDGDPPHRPGGTIAQAWSTAEMLRAYRLLDEAAP